MSDRPSDSLIELLARLRLATVGQVESQGPLVRRLAGDLPRIDALWIDTLVQARLVAPFQASEINAGRGERLAVGSYVLVRPLGTFGFAECFEGRHLDSLAPARVYVLARAHRETKTLLAELNQLIDRSARVASPGLLVLSEAGEDRGQLWAASSLEPMSAGGAQAKRGAWRPVRSAAEWMIDAGRFPPPVVMHLAQTIAAALAEAESAGLVHSDVRAASLLLSAEGQVYLAHPGLRAIVRPAEGYSLADLAPEAYETLAPEQVAQGTPPNVASDLYACGCLFWQLLAGRPALAGGNSLGRLQAAHAARIGDIRKVAPDTPEALHRAIEHCLARDPAARPSSFAALADLLGPPGRRGAALLARCLSDRKTRRSVLGSSPPRPRRREWLSTPQLAVAVVVLAAICLLTWRRGDWLRRPAASLVAVERAPTSPIAAPALAGASPAVPSNRPAPTGVNPPRSPAAAEVARNKPPVKPAANPVAYWTEDAQPPLVLPADRPIDLERIVPRAGQTIRAAEGRRAKVIVGGRPTVLAVEGVVFENIDFVLQPPPGAAAASMFVVAAARADFRGCTLAAQADESTATTAIVWRGPPRSARAAADWQGRLTLERTTVRGFGTAVVCPTAQRATVELSDALVIDCGTVARLTRPPRGDETCEFWLTHATVRQTGPLVRVDYEELPAVVGQLTIVAQESALAPRAGEPLVLVAGPGDGERLVAALEWQGQGSLVTPETAIAARQVAGGALDPVEDDELAVDGLARSEIGFAGASLTDAAQSLSVRWQGALSSSEPPGIDERVP